MNEVPHAVDTALNGLTHVGVDELAKRAAEHETAAATIRAIIAARTPKPPRKPRQPKVTPPKTPVQK